MPHLAISKRQDNRMRSAKKHVANLCALSLVPVMLQATALKTDLDDIQKALGVPASIAKVTDGVLPYGGGVPDVILVQDIHRHPEVQGHIAALLLYGSHHWGLKDVYLEGAQASAPVSLPADHTSLSFYDALQEGHLSGAEMAVALEPDSPVRLHGLEDPALYRENVAAYEAVERLRAPALQEIETARFFQNSLDFMSSSQSTDHWVRLQRMLQLRLKPADHAAYINDPYQGQEGSVLKQAVTAAERFYALADQRSETFLNNLSSAAMGGPQLVVVGGYHTSRMAQELRREGRSFAVLSPNVTQSGFEDLYARGMQQTISALKLRPQ
jgi:hypothetical protein